MDYCVKCYDLFMKGRDTFEELDAEVQSKLSKFSSFKLIFNCFTDFFSPSISLFSLQVKVI